MFQTFFTQRVLKGKLDTQGALEWYFGTQRELEHAGTQGTWALQYSRKSGTSRALRHLGTQGTWALRHSRHLGTWILEALDALETFYLAGLIWQLMKKINKQNKKTREFSKSARPRNPNMKRHKEKVHISAMALLKGREMVYNAFESRIFSLLSQDNSREPYRSNKSDDNGKTISQSNLSSDLQSQSSYLPTQISSSSDSELGISTLKFKAS